MISIMQRCVVVAIMVVAIAIGGKGGLALAGAPSIQSDDTGIVLRVPRGRRVFVQYYDPEDDSTGTGEGDVHAVVTEGVMQAAIQAAVVTAVAELKDGIAELKDGMKQDRDRAAEALAKVQEQIPSEDIVSGWVASFAATDGTSTHSLAKALQQKANKKEVALCACLDKGAIPTIVDSMDVLADTIGNQTTHVGSLVKFRDASTKCHDLGLLYNAKTDKCHDAIVVDCGGTVSKLGDGWAQPRCTGDTTLAGDACTVACKEGYISNSKNWTCGMDKQWSGPELKCVAPACTQHPLVGSRGITKGDCASTTKNGQQCTLGCAEGQPRGSMDIKCGLGAKWAGPAGLCNTGAVDCKKLANGRHVLSPGGKGAPSVQVNCVDGWMIIDPSIEPKGWANYFNGWKKYGTKGGGAYGPLKAGLLKHTTTSFVNWFKLPVKKPKTELSSSDDCKTCGGAQRGKAYHMSGDLYGCKWNNPNCPMQDDMECKQCIDDAQQMARGSCTHFGAYTTMTYNFHHQKDSKGNECQFNWWHTAPSIPAGGKFCMCYKPE